MLDSWRGLSNEVLGVIVWKRLFICVLCFYAGFLYMFSGAWMCVELFQRRCPGHLPSVLRLADASRLSGCLRRWHSRQFHNKYVITWLSSYECTCAAYQASWRNAWNERRPRSWQKSIWETIDAPLKTFLNNNLRKRFLIRHVKTFQLGT